MAGTTTQLLERVRAGDAAAAGELFERVYEDLKIAAARYLHAERPGHTMQATALVNEAFVRLAGMEQPDWESKTHLFNAAARAMRRILVDHARARNRLKRGGGEAARVPLDSGIAAPTGTLDGEVDDEALDAALTRLAAVSERQARLVELRYFCGLGEAEAARVLGVSQRTAASDWAFARAWLRRELKKEA